MAGKFYGKIGFGETVETEPGVYEDVIVEHNYYGDIKRNSRNLRDQDASVIPNITVDNSISIVSDAYANEHYFAMRYIEWQGALWIITKVTVAPPRLLLTLGGVYHGPKPDPAPSDS